MSPILTLHDPATARGYYAAGLWRPESFYALLARQAGARPEAPALRDGGRRLGWAALLRWVDAVAADLAAAGLPPGARVGLWLPNRAEAVVTLLACSRNGYVCMPSLHRNYTVKEIVTLLERAGAAAVVWEAGYGADAAAQDVPARLSGVETLRRRYTLPPGRGAAGDFPAPDADPAGPPPADDPDRVCYLAFTSGTTGTPKGVMHSANTILANCRDMVRDWGHGPTDVLLSLSPLSHHIAWVGLGQALLAGMELVLDDPPAEMTRLDWLLACGATYVMGVPTHAIDILAEQERRGSALSRLGAVRTFYMAGAPIPAATARAFLEQSIRPQNVYGMTENSSHQYTHPGDDAETVCATCGRGGPAYAVRIVDADDPDRPLPPGEVGQIAGRGAALMLGYFGNQPATEASFNREGWFLSGDLGVLDGAGNLRFVGRLKDLVIRGGHNIYPARVEELAMAHPAVEKAAAFPVPDTRLGERLCLAVLPVPGRSAAAEALLAHLRDAGLSPYDMPEFYLEVADFPLTASGKILKRELAERARSGALRPEPVGREPGGR